MKKEEEEEKKKERQKRKRGKERGGVLTEWNAANVCMHMDV